MIKFYIWHNLTTKKKTNKKLNPTIKAVLEKLEKKNLLHRPKKQFTRINPHFFLESAPTEYFWGFLNNYIVFLFLSLIQ